MDSVVKARTLVDCLEFQFSHDATTANPADLSSIPASPAKADKTLETLIFARSQSPLMQPDKVTIRYLDPRDPPQSHGNDQSSHKHAFTP